MEYKPTTVPIMRSCPRGTNLHVSLMRFDHELQTYPSLTYG